MSVADLYNLKRDDPISFLRFASDNQTEHIKIQKAIFEKFAINLPLFPIDPIPVFDLPGWARRHQSMHSSVNGLLGLQSNDLTSIDPNKPEDWVEWTQVHALEHYNIAQKLGLS